MRLSAFPDSGNWYKGNLHAHSYVSDGHLTPEQLMKTYREMGYSFLAITDHSKYGDYTQYNTEDIINIPGIEVHIVPEELPVRRQHHIVGLALPGKNTYKQGDAVRFGSIHRPQDIINTLLDHGNLPIYAHPHWSHARVTDLLPLTGIVGMEIYNNTCVTDFGVENSENYYDQLLWEGKRLFCFATDDTHQNSPDYRDYGGGWIVVKAPELTHEAIMSAILNGDFYASSGPEIKDFYIEDRRVHVLTSPCRRISFTGDATPGDCVYRAEGGLTELDLPLHYNDSYIRVMCEDLEGHMAWSQPIFLR